MGRAELCFLACDIWSRMVRMSLESASLQRLSAQTGICFIAHRSVQSDCLVSMLAPAQDVTVLVHSPRFLAATLGSIVRARHEAGADVPYVLVESAGAPVRKKRKVRQFTNSSTQTDEPFVFERLFTQSEYTTFEEITEASSSISSSSSGSRS